MHGPTSIKFDKSLFILAVHLVQRPDDGSVN